MSATEINVVEPRHPRRWWILAVLCLSLFMVVVDNTIVNVALPTLSTDLGASITSLQWIVDSYTLVFSALLLAFGYFGDRYGRALALRLGLIIFGITSVLAAVSTSTAGLIGARALMGIGAALVFPATLAIIINVFTDTRERAAAIGIWSGITGLAVAAGPVTGGFLLEHFWWGSLFLVNVPIVIVALVLGRILIPDSRDPQSGRFDRLGVLLSVAAVGMVIWSIIEGPHRGWSSPEVALTGTLGAIGIAVFVLYEARLAHPLLDVRLFRNARFSAASVAIAAAFFGLFGFIFLITQYMQLVLGYSPLEAGLRTVPFAVVTGVLSPAAIALMHRFGTKLVVASGLALMSTGFVMASGLQADSAYFGPVLAAMVVMAAGLGLTTSPATEAIMGALPPAKAGVGSAAIAHSAVKTDTPITEGFVALLEPFVDTVVICTMTALVLIFTGTYANPDQLEGAQLTSQAFASVISWFPYLLVIAIFLFAFSTMISWSYYGLKGFDYLFGDLSEKYLKNRNVAKYTYFAFFLIAIVVGSASNLGSVLAFSDMMILSMAFPNILGLLILAPEIRNDLKSYWGKLKSGEIKRYK